MVINGPKKKPWIITLKPTAKFPSLWWESIICKNLELLCWKLFQNFFVSSIPKKISTRFFSRFQLKWMFLITSRPVITFHSNRILIIISVINLTWIIILRWNKIISNTLTLKQNFLMFSLDSHSMVKLFLASKKSTEKKMS